MPLLDWIARPGAATEFPAIGFDHRRGGGGVVVTPGPDDVALGPTATLPAATPTLAGAMSAADKTRLDGLTGGAGLAQPASRAEAEASTLSDPEIVFLRTAGRTAPGDGGAALYARAAGQPAHPGRLQSADGSWWEQVAEAQGVDCRAFGSGAAAINDAMEFLAATGGGTVIVPGDVTLEDQLIARDRVTLAIPAGVTLTLGADQGTGAMIQGDDVPDFRITGGGRLEVAGLARFAVRLRGESRYPVDGLEITGHKWGLRLEANSTSGIGHVVLRNLHIHDNFKHPTDPGTLSQTGHFLSVTCRPSLGYPLTERLIAENIRLEAREPGATDGLNWFSKDLFSIQGCKIVWVDGLRSKNSGEVGATTSFSCQYVTYRNTEVLAADGHGIIMTGAHYRLDLTGTSGTFQVGETVTGAVSGATGEVEYLIDQGGGDLTMWVQLPSTAKIQDGETISGAVSGAAASVAASWYPRKLEVHPSVLTIGNGRDLHDLADYAGVQAQHVEEAYLSGTHRGNKPFGMKALNSSYRTGPYHCPTDAVQTAPMDEIGSTFLGQQLGPLEIASPALATGGAVANSGALVNGARQIELAQVAGPALIANRAGDGGADFGDVIRLARNGTVTGAIGTDGIQFPQGTATGAFNHSSLPAPAGVTRKINFSVSSRGGGAALVRSDGVRHTDLVSGLPSRPVPWTRATIEAETGAITGGAAYTGDGAGGGPALSVWTGTAWRHLALETQGGTATIADGAASAAISLPVALTGATYALTLAPHGPEPVWISAKSPTGFTLARAASIGALDVDWVALPAG